MGMNVGPFEEYGQLKDVIAASFHPEKADLIYDVNSVSGNNVQINASIRGIMVKNSIVPNYIKLT